MILQIVLLSSIEQVESLNSPTSHIRLSYCVIFNATTPFFSLPCVDNGKAHFFPCLLLVRSLNFIWIIIIIIIFHLTPPYVSQDHQVAHLKWSPMLSLQ